MSESTRRKFLHDVSIGLGTAAMAGSSPNLARASGLTTPDPENETSRPAGETPSSAIDFRYSPLAFQTAYCFPDDHYKSLIGQRGELRYGHPGGMGQPWAYFSEVVEFSLQGMEENQVGAQRLEAPGVPIVHTRLDRPEAFLYITTFATRRESEGQIGKSVV